MRLHAVTGLRFVAALWVVLFHFAPFRDSVPLIDRGYLAVPLFFVLSGFVLAYARGGARTRIRPHTFWLGRLARLYPAYLLALALAACLPPADAALRPDTVLAQLALVQAWLPGSGTWLNGPGWSLSVEIALYALFPLLAPVFGRLSNRAVLWLAASVWLGCTLGGLLLIGMVVPILPPGMAAALVLFWPPLHIGSFVLGLAAGTLVWRSQTLVPRTGTCLVGAAVLAGAACLAIPVPGAVLHDGLLSPVFVLLVVGLARGGPLARLLGSRPLVALGDASYALYILQAPVWAALVKLGLAAGLGFWPCCGLLILLALAVNRWFERPARVGLARLFDWLAQLWLGAGAYLATSRLSSRLVVASNASSIKSQRVAPP